MPLANTLFTAGALAGSLMLGFRPLAAQDAADSLVTAERAVSDASGHGKFATAITAALASDGAILWPGAPVIHGVEPVRRLLSAQRLLDSLRITWQPLGVEMAADASLGVTWGVAAAAGTAPPRGWAATSPRGAGKTASGSLPRSWVSGSIPSPPVR